jgi:hypothetical protein
VLHQDSKPQSQVTSEVARGCALAVGAVVKKSSEYRPYAEECRALANKVPLGEQHDAILTIAAIGEKLALVRANRAQAAATCSRHREFAF